MEIRTMGRILSCASVLVLAACGGSPAATGTDSGPRPDTGGGGGMCTRITGGYTLAGARTGGSCTDGDTLGGSLMVSGDPADTITTTLTVGGIDYDCSGRLDGCIWSATCMGTTGTADATANVVVTFNATGFTGTIAETRPSGEPAGCTQASTLTGTAS